MRLGPLQHTLAMLRCPQAPLAGLSRYGVGSPWRFFAWRGYVTDGLDVPAGNPPTNQAAWPSTSIARGGSFVACTMIATYRTRTARTAWPGRDLLDPDGAPGVVPFAVLILPAGLGAFPANHPTCRLSMPAPVFWPGGRPPRSVTDNQAADQGALGAASGLSGGQAAPAIAGRSCLGFFASSRCSDARDKLAVCSLCRRTLWPGLVT